MEYKKIVFGAFGYVFYYRRTLFQALLLPITAYVVLDAIEFFHPSPFTRFLAVILGLVLNTVIAISTHRIVLLGPASVSKWGLHRWTARETRFALHIIAMALITLAVGMTVKIPVVGIVLAIILICWLLGRLSLVFPAIALDQAVSFAYSWRMTRHHQWLMFFVVVLFPILVGIPEVLLAFIPYADILVSLVSAISMVLVVAALSVSYQLIISEEPK